MKQRPILFSTPMVQAILAGRKTQTRRVVKISIQRECDGNSPDCFSVYDKKGQQYYDETCGEPATARWFCPYGQPGDVLWVRETWQRLPDGFVNDETGGRFCFKADASREWILSHPEFRWKPSIHMPKDAARIWLEIKNVRVERLQDISEEDAKSEGVEEIKDNSPYGGTSKWRDYIKPNDLPFDEAKLSFWSLWRTINGPDSWQEDPFVWVVEFKQINKP